MRSTKSTLLAGTMLSAMAFATPSAVAAQIGAGDDIIILAQVQLAQAPGQTDPRDPRNRPGAGRPPGGPPPQQARPPAAAPPQQARPPMAPPQQQVRPPSAPPQQQVRPPVQPSAPRTVQPAQPIQPRPPVGAAPPPQRPAQSAPPIAPRQAPQTPPAGFGGRPGQPPAGAAPGGRPGQPAQSQPPQGQPQQGLPARPQTPPPAFGGRPPGAPATGQAPGQAPGQGQPPVGAAPQQQRPGTPGAIRPADGRPPFGGGQPGQAGQPPSGQPPVGQRPGIPGQPVQPPVGQQPGVPGQPNFGQRPPGTPGVPGQPPVGQQGVPGQPGQPNVGQRPPGTPGVPGQPPVGQQQGVPGQPGQPNFGQRPPGTPGVPGQPGQRGFGQQQGVPPGQPGQQPNFGQRPPGVPGQPGQPGFGQQQGVPPGQPGQQPNFGQRPPGGPGQPGFGGPGQGGFAGGQPPSGPPEQRRGSRIGPAGAAALGVGAGLVGGFLLSRGARAERVDDIRSSRREVDRDGVRVIYEPERTIIRDGEGVFVRHDENARFRQLGGDLRAEQRGNEMYTFYDRPGGVRVITVTDSSGQLIRRIRRYPDGREVVIIDNSFRPPPRTFEEQIIVLPEPEIHIPRERYIVDAERADEGLIYETLTAPPVQRPPRRYTLDEVRYSPTVRAYTRSVDIDTINFATGSWEVTPDQAPRLATIAAALGRAVQANPNEVFLIEGHTDAVGNDVDNMSLSDRRAQSVAAILTQNFNIPPENLTTQGYGSQYPKVQTQGASRDNRRVTLRRVTELLNQQNTQAPQQ